MLTIFCFHTNDPLYKKHAQILKLSAEKFNLKIIFSEFSQDDWQKIIAFKPQFIAEMRKKLQGKILFLDADAIILDDIQNFFSSIEEDIAANYSSDNLLMSGTLFINDTPNAHSLIEEWANKQKEKPTCWDQVVLQELIDEYSTAGRIKLNKIPPCYTFVFDTYKNIYGGSVKPIIEHLQASRDKRWIEKYNRRNSLYRYLMRFPYLLKSTKKISRRHDHVNKRTKELGIDIQLTLNDLIKMR